MTDDKLWQVRLSECGCKLYQCKITVLFTLDISAPTTNRHKYTSAASFCLCFDWQLHSAQWTRRQLLATAIEIGILCKIDCQLVFIASMVCISTCSFAVCYVSIIPLIIPPFLVAATRAKPIKFMVARWAGNCRTWITETFKNIHDRPVIFLPLVSRQIGSGKNRICAASILLRLCCPRRRRRCALIVRATEIHRARLCARAETSVYMFFISGNIIKQ